MTVPALDDLLRRDAQRIPDTAPDDLVERCQAAVFKPWWKHTRSLWSIACAASVVATVLSLTWPTPVNTPSMPSLAITLPAMPNDPLAAESQALAADVAGTQRFLLACLP